MAFAGLSIQTTTLSCKGVGTKSANVSHASRTVTTYPVMAVAAYDVASGWLVLGPVPRVHDSELALVPCCSSIGLAFVLVTASGADISSILETSTVNKMCERLKFECIIS